MACKALRDGGERRPFHLVGADDRAVVSGRQGEGFAVLPAKIIDAKDYGVALGRFPWGPGPLPVEAVDRLEIEAVARP